MPAISISMVAASVPGQQTDYGNGPNAHLSRQAFFFCQQPAVYEVAPGRKTFFNQLIAAFQGWKDERNDPSGTLREAVVYWLPGRQECLPHGPAAVKARYNVD